MREVRTNWEYEVDKVIERIKRRVEDFGFLNARSFLSVEYWLVRLVLIALMPLRFNMLT